MSKIEPSGPPEPCEACGTGLVVYFLTIADAVDDYSEEEEFFELCAKCSDNVRAFAKKCKTAGTAKPVDGTPTGSALVHLSKFHDDEDWEQWVFCGSHAKALADWLHSDERSGTPRETG